jgi:hypothetical protein
MVVNKSRRGAAEALCPRVADGRGGYTRDAALRCVLLH